MNEGTAAHEAATIEAMQTGGAIPSPLWTAQEDLRHVRRSLVQKNGVGVH